MVEGRMSDYCSHKVTCLKVRYAEVLTCNIFLTLKSIYFVQPKSIFFLFIFVLFSLPY